MVRELTPQLISEWKENFMCIVSSPRRSGKTWLVDYIFSCFKSRRIGAIFCISPTSTLQGAFMFLPKEQHIMPSKETFASNIDDMVDFQQKKEGKGV